MTVKVDATVPSEVEACVKEVSYRASLCCTFRDFPQLTTSMYLEVLTGTQPVWTS